MQDRSLCRFAMDVGPVLQLEPLELPSPKQKPPWRRLSAIASCLSQAITPPKPAKVGWLLTIPQQRGALGAQEEPKGDELFNEGEYSRSDGA